jgi:hypothetical protein
MSSQSSNGSNDAVGSAAIVLTIVFIVLKLTHVIDWSWWWVLSPLWISALIAVAILLIIFAIVVAVKRWS